MEWAMGGWTFFLLFRLGLGLISYSSEKEREREEMNA